MTTAAEVPEAETFARDQRLANAKLLRLDEAKTETPAALDLAQKVHVLADKDPLKFDAMLGNKKVGELFRRGALYFGRDL